MMRLRSGLIGSMRAWLPSRRSTAHHRGAAVMCLSGQVRSGSSTVNASWYGRYLWIGIAEAVCVFFMSLCSFAQSDRSANGVLWQHQSPRRVRPGVRTRRGS
jgi:hypothetical protein